MHHVRESSRNSLQSWAKVYWAHVGLLTSAITFATVNVLPEPVTPISVCFLAPSSDGNKPPNDLRLIPAGLF